MKLMKILRYIPPLIFLAICFVGIYLFVEDKNPVGILTAIGAGLSIFSLYGYAFYVNKYVK